MADDQFQYVKLPDGTYGKFLSTANDGDIQKAISRDFPSAVSSDGGGTIPNANAQAADKLKSIVQPVGAGFDVPSGAKPGPPKNARFGTPEADFQPAEDADRQLQEEEQANLHNVAKTGKEIPGSATKQTGLRIARSVSSVGEGLVSPKNVAIAGAAAVAPEIVLPALAIHGAAQVAKNAPETLKGNPDAVEATLSGGAEAVGGVAGTAESLRSGVANTATGRAISKTGQGASELLGRKLTPEAAAKVPSSSEFQPSKALAPKDVLQHASDMGVDLTPAQATNEPSLKNVQAVGERSLVGGKKLNEAIEANKETFQKGVRDFADRVDQKAMGSSPEQAGESIQQAAETAKSVAHENAGNAFQNLKWTEKTPVDVSGVQEKWTKMQADMKPVLDNAPKEVADRLRQVLDRGANIGTSTDASEDLAPKIGGKVKVTDGPLKGKTVEVTNIASTGSVYVRAGQNSRIRLVPSSGYDVVQGTTPEISFQQAQQLRSFFREMGDTPAADLPKRYQGLWKNLSSDLDSAMESSAKKAGFDKEWREANQGWKDFSEKYGDRQSTLYKILNQQDPTKIVNSLLQRSSAKDIEILQNEGMTSATDALKRQVVEDIARNNFRVTKDGLAGYPHSFLKQLFGDDTKELYLKSEIGRRLGHEANPSGTAGVQQAAGQLSELKDLARSTYAAKSNMPRNAAKYLPAPNRPPASSPRMLPTIAATTAARSIPRSAPGVR